MSRWLFLLIIIACIAFATIVSLAPETGWQSQYEEIGARTNRLFDIILKSLATLALIKYLFGEHQNNVGT